MIRQGLFLVLLTTSLAGQAEQTGTVIAIKKENAVTDEQQMPAKGTVTRSALTSQVQAREPVDELEKITAQQNQLFYFTELRGMSGQTAKHRWEYNGKLMAEVDFNVKGPRWRVWSSKIFKPDWIGEWKVSVINAAGEVISEKNFSYDTAVLEPATQQ